MNQGIREIAAREIILVAGDSFYFDSSHPHAMRAHGGTTARFLAVIL